MCSTYHVIIPHILNSQTLSSENRWEGRCLWGALIFAVINLAQQAQPMFTDKENFRRLCCLLVCFALACKNQLAGDSIEVDSEYLLSRGLISMKELEHVISRPGWQESPRLYALFDCSCKP